METMELDPLMNSTMFQGCFHFFFKTNVLASDWAQSCDGNMGAWSGICKIL